MMHNGRTVIAKKTTFYQSIIGTYTSHMRNIWQTARYNNNNMLLLYLSKDLNAVNNITKPQHINWITIKSCRNQRIWILWNLGWVEHQDNQVWRTNRFVGDLVLAQNFVQLAECTDPASLVTLILGQHQNVWLDTGRRQHRRRYLDTDSSHSHQLHSTSNSQRNNVAML